MGIADQIAAAKNQLTRLTSHSIVLRMETKEANSLEAHISRLETSVSELMAYASRLKNENRSLRASQESLYQERATLIERNDAARNQIEAMIRRLKNMESTG